MQNLKLLFLRRCSVALTLLALVIVCSPTQAHAALSRTQRSSGTSGTSATFTPANGSLLVVLWGGVTSGTGDVGSPTISGGGLTWVPIDFKTTTTFDAGWWTFTGGWYAVVGTGASMSVSVSAAGETFNGQFLSVQEYTGYNTSSPIGAVATASRTDTDGAWSYSLSGTPQTTSQVLSAAATDNWWDTASTVISPGTGWSEIGQYPTAGSETQGSVQLLTSPSSATVLWNAVNVDEPGTSPSSATSIAFEVKASTGSGNVQLSKPPNNLGLIGYWSFNEGTSTRAGDFSGNGYSGTLTGSPTWTTGKFGTGLNFSPSSSYVNLGTSDTFNFTTGDFTVSFWEKSTGLADSAPFIGRRSAGPSGWQVQTGGNFAEFCMDTTCLDGTVALDDGRWHHVTVAYSGGNVSFYTDGVFDVTRAVGTASTNAGTQLRIGARQDNSRFLSDSTQVLMDEVRIYNRSLTASQITALYKSGQTVIGSSAKLQQGSTLESGLVGHWTFDGKDTTDKVYDVSGNGNHGYVLGSATSSVKTIGKIGQALRFDGSGVRVSTVDINAIDGASQLTISAWIKQDSLVSSVSMISKWNLSDNFSFYVADPGNGGPNEMSFNADGGASKNTTGSAHKAGVWEHWVVVYNGTLAAANRVTMFKDGVAQTLGGTNPPATIGTNSSPVTIGADATPGAYFNGSIDDVRIYTRALSASEVAILYNLGRVIRR